MKKFVVYLSLLLSFLFLNSCTNLLSDSGYVTFTLPETVPAKAERAAYAVEDLEYSISVKNQDDSITEEMTAAPGETVTLELEPGVYTIAIEASVKNADGSKKTVYIGSVSDVTITAGETTKTSISLYGFVTVTFDANGGSGTMDSVTVVKGTEIELPECTFKPAGKETFAGWSTTKEGKEALKVKESYKASADVTLYAVWAKNPKAEKVEFSVKAGKVRAGTKVTLTTKTEGAKIYYTTDGSDPLKAEKKTEYKEPVTISKSMTIKAYAVSDSTIESDVTAAAYMAEVKGETALIKPEEITKGGLLSLLMKVEDEGSTLTATVDASAIKNIKSYTWVINGVVAENETTFGEITSTDPVTGEESVSWGSISIIGIDGNSIYLDKTRISSDIDIKIKYNITLGFNSFITCIVETEDGYTDDITCKLFLGI